MYFDNLNMYSNKEVGGNDRFYFEKFICMMYIFFFFLIGKYENVDYYSYLYICF